MDGQVHPIDDDGAPDPEAQIDGLQDGCARHRPVRVQIYFCGGALSVGESVFTSSALKSDPLWLSLATNIGWSMA
ncbi:MAG: hypothetical protein NVS9B1_22220 [Candidatus Dormibacteraceae bacterium]